MNPLAALMLATSFLPPLSLFNGALVTLQAAVTASSRHGEIINPAAYSKFSCDTGPSATVSGRAGMLIIYSPALLACTLQLVRLGYDGGLPALVALLLFLHFAKRELEVLFLHDYSGGMELQVCMPIGVFYTLVSAIIFYAAGLAPLAQGLHVVVGVVMFIVGELGNFYHHWLLAVTRNSQGTPRAGPPKILRSLSVPLIPRSVTRTMVGSGRNYFIPAGGLFEEVTMPHYFFELIAWYGIFVVAPRLNILLVCTGMTSYLSGRAASTTKWYKEKFGEKWPKRRKHLVPFLY